MKLSKIFLFTTLLIATWLRFYRLEAQSFWNDEGNSARIAERSLDLIVAGAAGDIHPPGYYLVLAAWRAVAGQSEFALRGLSAFAGILLVAWVYRLGRHYFAVPAALGAAAFAALHPALIYYSQEARMYALVAALGAGSWWLAERCWQLTLDGRRSAAAWQLTFAFLLAAGLYTHYSFGFIVIAINVLFLIRLGHLLLVKQTHFAQTQPAERRDLVSPFLRPLQSSKIPEAGLRGLVFNLYLPQLAALCLFSPWLPTAIRQLTSWPAGRDYLPLGEALAGAFTWLALGPAAGPNMVTGWAALLAALTVGMRYRQTFSVLVWLWVPLGLTLALGLFSPAFAKFLIGAVPALCVLVGGGFTSFFYAAPRPLLKAAVTLCWGVWLLAASLSLGDLYFNPAYARADYRGVAHYLETIAKPRDAILLNAPNQWEVFTYYHPDLSNVFPVATSRPLNVPEQLAELETLAARHDRLFVLYWGDAQSDPGRVIEAWLNEHTFKAYDQWYGDVRLAAYAVPRAAADLQTRTRVMFGDRIVLEGYALQADTFFPGDILQLTLFWRVQSPVSDRYKVFVHLIDDPTHPPVAQHDGEPGGGLALTTTWLPGQTVADNHGVYLPLDLPPDRYSLVVGLYAVDDGTRLTQSGEDALFLAAIQVR